MSLSKELTKTSNIVLMFLKFDPKTRNCDDYLYLKVCEYVNVFCTNIAFQQVLMNRKEFGIPPFETVRRARQKLQKRYPELAAAAEVETMRENNEEEYRKYVKSR